MGLLAKGKPVADKITEEVKKENRTVQEKQHLSKT